MTGPQTSLDLGAPTAAVSRKTDPPTSREAAANATRKLRQSQDAVLRIFKAFTAMTDEELLKRYMTLSRDNPALYPPQSPSGIRSRRSELTEAKHGVPKLVDSGDVRKYDGRRGSHTIWRLIDRG